MIIKINFLTGLAWTRSIEVEADGDNIDLMSLIDSYYQEHKGLPVTLFRPEDISEEEQDGYLPINGGEFYILGIDSVQYDYKGQQENEEAQ